MDDLELTERLITAGEFAALLDVTEDDVRRWMSAGRIPFVGGPDGEPLVPVRERHSVDGAVASGITTYSFDGDPEFRAELADRRRKLEVRAVDLGGVDVDALAQALASRLAAVIPPVCRVTAEAAVIRLHDEQGRGTGIDLVASFPDIGSDAQRVRAAAATFLEHAQDELTELTTDPWPRRGRGSLPTPRAELTDDHTTIRLFYGASNGPVLELDLLLVSDVLRTRDR